MSESVEYLLRQQGKVKTPKTLVKVVRAHTRELKRQRKSEVEAKQVEALGGIAKELISAGGQALGGQITGPLLVIGGLSSTETGRRFLITAGDGLVKLAGVLAEAIAAAWFTGVAKPLNEILHPAPPATPAGVFCYRATLFGQTLENCYNTALERDRAMAIARATISTDVVAFDK